MADLVRWLGALPPPPFPLQLAIALVGVGCTWALWRPRVPASRLRLLLTIMFVPNFLTTIWRGALLLEASMR